MPEKRVPVKKRRFLSKDYDFIAKFVTKETETRKSLKFRKEHESLWEEVDRQVRMKPMEIIRNDPELDWRSALEMGDMSTASEVLSADIMRLTFPEDRNWLGVHTNIDFKRLQHRTDKEISDADRAKIQKKADSELRALMSQQHKDFGFRARVELSVKELLHHGSFVAVVDWEEMQQYAMGGVFRSAAAPVWTPHSMWNCYPETLNLGTNLIYTGTMIICAEKEFEWVMRQTNFINLKKFNDMTKDEKSPVELKHFYGNINVQREGESVYLPNMRIIVANEVVLFAQPMDNTSIIYGGYDRVDVRDPYYMSPLVKQAMNHRILTELSNKFVDNVELKLQPPGVYDANDPQMVAQGGPKIIPGHNTPTQGGAANYQQIDVGDPSWAIEAIRSLRDGIKEGLGVSSSRAGAQRQADRITATQIEEESAGSNIRTIDVVGKLETGVESYCYIQHEMNVKNLSTYKYYNPDVGMPDFGEINKEDLPREARFEAIGAKGVLSERRRSLETREVMKFLMDNDRTADLPKMEEMAKQMLLDAGNKNPERLLNVTDGESEVERRIQQIQEAAQEAIQTLQEQLQEVSRKLASKEMESKLNTDQLQLRNERAEGTETALRNEIRALKAEMNRTSQIMTELGKIKDETLRQEKIKEEIDKQREIEGARTEVDSDDDEPKQVTHPPVIVNIQKAGGFQVLRDPTTQDMTGVKAVDDAKELVGEVSGG